MKVVYVFPGQGSQQRGMGQGLFEKYPELVRQANDCLGYSIEELCLQDRERLLGQTEYTQPALYVVNVLHYLDRLAVHGERPAFLAGHSLGEYCALFAAGGFDFRTGLQLVMKRGELMSRAPKGAMAAVVGLDRERVVECIGALPYRNIDIANINSSKQCIVSGVYDELLAPAVREAFVAAGGTFIPLNVSAAFHSRCMAGVQQEFAEYLAKFELQELVVPVIANYTARPYPTKEYSDGLAAQIANPVRWYESISWLLQQGCEAFQEIGPGNVLTKLLGKIREDPLRGGGRESAWRVVGSTGNGKAQRTRLVFMFGGQGSQYPQMGRELYETHGGFRQSMDRCSARYQAARGSSLVHAIYDKSRKGGELDDILESHAAIYAIGCSLTEVLRQEGFEPDGVLGHSLGEYVAATVAGAMSWEDGLDLVMAQAELLNRRCSGGMLSVLAAPRLFEERSDVFSELSLAGVNFSGNFLVSGAESGLAHAQYELDRAGVVAVRLPVRQAFHSERIDSIRTDFAAVARKIVPRLPRMPIYSAAYGGLLAPDVTDRWSTYLWDVVRERIRFDEVVAKAFPAPEQQFYVDLSASGSIANFLKHGYGPNYRSAAAISRFGNDVTSLRNLRAQLVRAQGGAPGRSSVASA